MTIQEFVARWSGSTLKERSAAQSHFNDLCSALGVPSPTEADPHGTFYTFERGAEKTDGGDGWADVWFRGHFAWEYKGAKADLRAAYRQIRQYVEDLENPPLLIVCDLDRFEVHTNFTGTVKKMYAFSLETLDQPENLRVLRAVFTDPESLRPTITPEEVTEEAAARFGALALALHDRGVDPHRAAHFLVQLLFCLFAEDVGLLPKGMFTNLLAFTAKRPDRFPAEIEALLLAMRDGGVVAFHEIVRFNGGLFTEVAVEPLTKVELDGLVEASGMDWGNVEPAIFGTLFERSLDPAKRSQLGAHYTGRADIERVVEPVVMAPLRRRWAEVRAQADIVKQAWDAADTAQKRRNRRDEFAALLFGFQEELASVTILDPGCGSGNFLYVALAALKDLEKEVIAYGAANGLPMMLPRVTPSQLHGLEINEYAREIAQVVIWIGYLQWMTANGFQVNRDPVLEPLETIRLKDALLDRIAEDGPREATWPPADVVIGNPPFLGGKRLRAELGDATVDDLFAVYDGRVAREADLVCYFFEKARAEIAAGRAKRAGLLATNSIRGGANRRVLERIKQSGDLFMAWSDEPWVLDGAAVRISIIGFDGGTEQERSLDGIPVTSINADLTGATDVTTSNRLTENLGIAFMGDTKGGPFDVPGDRARAWLALPPNPNGRPNGDVVRPWVNGLDVTRRPRDMWIVDFGIAMSEQDAALYEAPFEYVREHVKPMRAANNRASYRERWWLHVEARSGMRSALRDLDRFICTPTVAKHRLFVWSDGVAIPDHQLIVFARADDYFFGVLHSRAHAVWSLRMGTSLEDRPRYTPTTCFETFPFPLPTDQQREAIAAASKALDDVRRRWLDPDEGADEAELKRRTLTNLYNARPSWLAHAHDRLDRAVWAAYGWDDPGPAATDDDTILTRLLALNLDRSSSSSALLNADASHEAVQ